MKSLCSTQFMDLKDRVIQRFLRLARTPKPVTTSDLKEVREDLDDLRAFASAVMKVAKQPGTRKFHDDRAFIGSIKERGFPRSDRHMFDSKLVASHIEGFLRLTRADLVGAMDRKDIDDSEVLYQNATFNFVAI